ncbi:MAG TPA: hypothetical protein DCQ04_05840 [Actinobacteria bacterium]|nr:hypothetical protein [Actinomycetota bacterium]
MGLVARVPWPKRKSSLQPLSALAYQSWFTSRALDAHLETSEVFAAPALVQAGGQLFNERVAAWGQRITQAHDDLQATQAAIDELCFEAYNIEDADRQAIRMGLGQPIVEEGHIDSGSSVSEPDRAALAAELVSWSVGVAFGRFDVRFDAVTKRSSVDVDPFDPLSVLSPGMLVADDLLPEARAPAEYPIKLASVLVNDPGHELDIAERVRSVFDVVFGDDAERWWLDVGEAIGGSQGDVGEWLRRAFFVHHLKTYSEARRKAPVIWPMGTASGSYVVWLYAHGVTDDSLLRVSTELVAPKLMLEERRLSEQAHEAGPNPSANQRKGIDGQERLIDELQQFMDQITAVAPLWHPDLNDGTVVVLAPLWGLFAHHRPWSKELRRYWEKLLSGELDWAQLAMRLWPERVVPKCATDRSLAIAHGLEGVFWIQERENLTKWHPRETPIMAIDELVADRTDLAIKAALEVVVR